MKNIKLLEEMLQEQETILKMIDNPCNQSKYDGMLQAIRLLGYDYLNGKIFKCN